MPSRGGPAAGGALDSLSAHLSVSAASRAARRSGAAGLYDRLRSCEADARFVGEVLRGVPAYRRLLVAPNLRCGAWYRPAGGWTLEPAHFKSTDGHTGHWAFSTSRLNLHVALAAAARGGAALVDATTRGKSFPDALTKTVPMWCAVLNAALRKLATEELAARGQQQQQQQQQQQRCEVDAMGAGAERVPDFPAAGDDWDVAVHLPPWIPASEVAQIGARVDGWADELLAVCGGLLAPLAAGPRALRRPLRCLWVGQRSIIIKNVHHGGDEGGLARLPFTPILCVSASMPVSSGATAATKALQAAGGADGAEDAWRYMPGAGDDEECFARLSGGGALTASLFWENVDEILAGDRAHCHDVVTRLVREHGSARGGCGGFGSAAADTALHAVGETGLLLGSAAGASRQDVWRHTDAVLCVGAAAARLPPPPLPAQQASQAVHNIAMKDTKSDRTSLRSAVPRALEVLRCWMRAGKRRCLVYCDTGSDVCACIAIAAALTLRLRGIEDIGDGFAADPKAGLKRAAAAVSMLCPASRPSRSNLKAARLGVEDVLGLSELHIQVK